MLMPDPEEVESLVLQQLGGTALFAARFRENAGRSLLLPKRRAGSRAPLWQQRKKGGDLLAVAARFGSFPVLLETYRECLRDIFDMPALVDTLMQVRKRAIKVVVVDPETPSPFAASLLFGYVANFLYDGDAPLAERRAQALSVDQSQLRELHWRRRAARPAGCGRDRRRRVAAATSVTGTARAIGGCRPRHAARSRRPVRRRDSWPGPSRTSPRARVLSS